MTLLGFAAVVLCLTDAAPLRPHPAAPFPIAPAEAIAPVMPEFGDQDACQANAEGRGRPSELKRRIDSGRKRPAAAFAGVRALSTIRLPSSDTCRRIEVADEPCSCDVHRIARSRAPPGG